jgi:GT2 family glycosyltransferase
MLANRHNGTAQPTVYLVLVNYNSAQDTVQCLESLFRVTYQNLSIILIDNASTDRSLDVITSWLSQREIPFSSVNISQKQNNFEFRLIILKSDVNLGFGGACNQGIARALENNIPFVLLLNNDTSVEPEFIDHLMTTMLSSENVGAVGGKILYADDRRRIWYCGGRIDFVRCMAHHFDKDKQEEFETGFITGCTMLLNMNAIRRIGMFDERYFLNVEDWDLSYRLKAAGWTLRVNPRAVIYHKISGSIGGTFSFNNQFYFHRNRLLFLAKHRTGFMKVLLFTMQYTVILPVWVLLQIARGNFMGIKALFRAMEAFLTRKTGQYVGRQS